MFKNCLKEDLRIVALELELIQYTIEDRKKAEEDRKRVEEDSKKEAENRLREKELELARLNVRVNSDNERKGEGCNSLDALVKSVRILTVKMPNRSEDDIIVFSETFEDHLIRLRLVLKCLQEAGLKLNSKKCLFAAQEVKILGHLVSSNGVRPDPDKIKAVRNFPTPKNIHDIRSFLGLCSYFRRFIKGFCYLAEPLQSLLKSGVEFHWGPEEVEAFNSLKKALTSDPVLGMYDERASTEIHTDASGYGIGAVLVQIQNNVEKVIAYASRTLTKAEKNYSTTERECLAIVWATNKFRPYIFGKHFTVVSSCCH
ncbi:retrovirus-related Pol polyprotein from transposon 17.6 [Trichonephila clavipes]|nr:retrovirus-related Pol polyprotein from transposon 17.6 [Trichonephila clavipes]